MLSTPTRIGALAVALIVTPGSLGAHTGGPAAHPASIGRNTAFGSTSAGQRHYFAPAGGFELNLGQSPGGVNFLLRSADATIFLTRAAMVVSLRTGIGSSAGQHVVRLTYRHADANPSLVGVHRLPTIVNSYVGRDPRLWRTHIPTFQGVLYRGLYPGADLELRTLSGALEYRWVLHPSARVGRVGLSVRGARVAALPGGGVALLAGGRSLVVGAPTAFQWQGGVRRPVSARLLTRGSVILPAIGQYDPSRPLTIDPTLEYGRVVGGSDGDIGTGVAADADGNAYMTGSTNSTNFPTDHAVQRRSGGDDDAFVTKLDPNGSAVYSTYLGGSGSEEGIGIAVHHGGHAYVVGTTLSDDFPTLNALQPTLGSGNECSPSPDIQANCTDAFVAGLSPIGALQFSTYLGGADDEDGNGIAVDKAGHIYVAGRTDSTTFPILHAFQHKNRGNACRDLAGRSIPCTDGFVAKLDASGRHLLYSTYLGGSGDDAVNGIAVSGERAYVIGDTHSQDFPLRNAVQSTAHNRGDAFVAELNASGSALVFSTYLGGSRPTSGIEIAADHAGNAYAAGYTSSPNFPVNNALDAHLQGDTDAFVTKFRPSGGRPVYCTFLGGSGTDAAYGVAVDHNGQVYVAGDTDSSNFPVVAATQRRYGGVLDAFLARLDPAGSALSFSTYLGGSNLDSASGVAVDASGDAFVVGVTNSRDFPGGKPPTDGSDRAFLARVAVPTQTRKPHRSR